MGGPESKSSASRINGRWGSMQRAGNVSRWLVITHSLSIADLKARPDRKPLYRGNDTDHGFPDFVWRHCQAAGRNTAWPHAGAG